LKIAGVTEKGMIEPFKSDGKDKRHPHPNPLPSRERENKRESRERGKENVELSSEG